MAAGVAQSVIAFVFVLCLYLQKRLSDSIDGGAFELRLVSGPCPEVPFSAVLDCINQFDQLSDQVSGHRTMRWSQFAQHVSALRTTHQPSKGSGFTLMFTLAHGSAFAFAFSATFSVSRALNSARYPSSENPTTRQISRSMHSLCFSRISNAF